ncbi:MAG: tRNA 2-thiocytidine biosynthesis TtcA family protein [Christensenellaceae bacterium]|jgi:tRNA(Ile)-lysidine synthase TilS/MesJ|nr:tRNA 2-thiocytidine biosynthesis TtcA family protein [Christensenellaceae bacterium]
MKTIKEIEQSITKKFHTKIWTKFIEGINRFKLLDDGDKIAVCVSGGKDSFLLAKCFQELKRQSDKNGKSNFEVIFLSMNPGYNAENLELLKQNAENLGVPLTIFDSPIYDTVEKMGGNPCYMCARMRRGNLYAKAKELGCNKIALAHHIDDAIETTMMNILYAGKFATMMPKIKSKNFEGMSLIRPLILVSESEIIAWRNYHELKFLNCACRFTENCVINENEPGESTRRKIKFLIKDLKKLNPAAPLNIFNSANNVVLNQILGYKKDGEYFSNVDC